MGARPRSNRDVYTRILFYVRPRASRGGLVWARGSKMRINAALFGIDAECMKLIFNYTMFSRMAGNTMDSIIGAMQPGKINFWNNARAPPYIGRGVIRNADKRYTGAACAPPFSPRGSLIRDGKIAFCCRRIFRGIMQSADLLQLPDFQLRLLPVKHIFFK